MSDNQSIQIDGRDLRRAFGNFATGVTIVTTLDADGNPLPGAVDIQEQPGDPYEESSLNPDRQ